MNNHNTIVIYVHNRCQIEPEMTQEQCKYIYLLVIMLTAQNNMLALGRHAYRL